MSDVLDLLFRFFLFMLGYGGGIALMCWALDGFRLWKS